jgi:hypothetical protein
MTNKTKQQRLARRAKAQQQLVQAAAKLRIAPQPKKTVKKKTPFSDVGSILGGGIGSMFGFPAAQGIGRWLGSGIGSIFGSGDYEVVGQQPSYNVLSNGAQIPKFSTTRQTNVVSHREYLGDISGTVGFTNRQYPINPGSAVTFPWLSTLAQCYQQYKIHGLIFEFRPLITDFVTNGAPGVVVMATNYNADEPLYTTKQAMENSEYAVSVKPTCNLMHGVECATNQTVLSELYVRPAGLASNLDLKFTDLGNFQFATQGNPTQLLGELWCSYTIEFFKPLLPNDVGGNVQSQSVSRQSVSAAAPFGTLALSSAGDFVDFSITSNSVSFRGQPDNLYLVQLNWAGTVATAVAFPALTITNGTLHLAFFNDTGAAVGAPTAGVLNDKMSYSIMIKCTATSPSIVTLTLGGAGVYPGGTVTADILLTQVSDNI